MCVKSVLETELKCSKIGAEIISSGFQGRGNKE